ncbi:MAG: hypothetical protein JO182_30265 [Acidobacteriaceae bacterium]|nr:hypothetical protein [Acidobacteriaceae bacterium]
MAIANALGKAGVIASIAPSTIDQTRSRAAGEVRSMTTGAVVGVELGNFAALTRRVVLSKV